VKKYGVRALKSSMFNVQGSQFIVGAYRYASNIRCQSIIIPVP